MYNPSGTFWNFFGDEMYSAIVGPSALVVESIEEIRFSMLTTNASFLEFSLH